MMMHRVSLLKSVAARVNKKQILRLQSSFNAPYVGSAIGDLLKDPSLLKSSAHFNGKWSSSESGETFDILDPATGKVVAKVPSCGVNETNQAVVTAHAAQVGWAKLTGKERSLVLRRWYELMVENKDDLATLLTIEAGKPLAEALGEIAYASSFFEWFAEEAKRTYGEVIPPTLPNRQILVTKEPVGVAALITPWNFPAAMITRKLGPCLAAGCGAVIKPAEDTPLSALALLELGHRAGVPEGLVGIVTTPREAASAVGEALCKHPQIRKLSFTGSTPVGVTLAKWCAEGMKRTSLELGGNAPFIVFDDADVEVAVNAAMAAKFRNSGQTCVSSNRFFVQSGIHDKFVAALVKRVSQLKVGHGLNKDTTQGPLINQTGKSKVTRHIQDATSKGAKIVFGDHCNNLADNVGNFVSPVVLTGCDPATMACFKEETFGPLISITTFDDEDHVVEIANQSDVGLAGYFCSNDLKRVMRVARALEVGMVGVNEGGISTEVAPFGGVKMSGVGREGSSIGIDEYLNIKYVCLGLS